MAAISGGCKGRGSHHHGGHRLHRELHRHRLLPWNGPARPTKPKCHQVGATWVTVTGAAAQISTGPSRGHRPVAAICGCRRYHCQTNHCHQMKATRISGGGGSHCHHHQMEATRVTGAAAQVSTVGATRVTATGAAAQVSTGPSPGRRPVAARSGCLPAWAEPAPGAAPYGQRMKRFLLKVSLNFALMACVAFPGANGESCLL